MAGQRADDVDERVASLVGDWSALPDVAERMGVEVTRVRSALADGELVALRVGGITRVPDLFLVADPGDPGREVPLPELKGTLSVLADSGFRPAEAVAWLFTPDETLAEGRPVDALRKGRKTEVRRRAQALAF